MSVLGFGQSFVKIGYWHLFLVTDHNQNTGRNRYLSRDLNRLYLPTIMSVSKQQLINFIFFSKSETVKLKNSKIRNL